MDSNWRTTAGGFCSAFGKGLAGIGGLAFMAGTPHVELAFWTAFVGVVLTCLGSGFAGANAADAAKKENDLRLPPMSTFVFAGVCIFFLTGCETATPNRKKAEEAAFIAYEQAHTNDSASYEKMKAANLVNYQRKKDLELKADLQKLEIQSKLDAVTWTTQAIAAETVRLQALHDTQIAAYRERIGQADAIRAKNEQVNLGTARQIRSGLNSSKPPEIIDQSKEIEAGAGAVPQPPPLIDVK